MFDELKFRFRVIFEKAVTSALNVNITPVHSFWYLTDPDHCLTDTPLIQSESIGHIFDRLGLQGFYEEIIPNETIMYPDVGIRKANGHPPSFLTANYHASGCLATLSFVGQRHEIHVVAKCPETSGVWQIDHICLEEGSRIYELDCSDQSNHRNAVESVLDVFHTATSIVFFDPQAREQDADIEVGKMLRDIFEDIEIRQAVTRERDIPLHSPAPWPPL